MAPRSRGDLYDISRSELSDASRSETFHAARTRPGGDCYVFRIAPLRHVALTAPYFHDGSAATLHDAVSIMGWVECERRFTPEEVDAVDACLESLTGEFPLVTHPQLPRAWRRRLR